MLAVVKDTVDLRRRKPHGLVRSVMEIVVAAGFDNRNILRHHFVFRSGLALDLGASGAVIVVGVADEKNLCVAVFKAERFNGSS